MKKIITLLCCVGAITSAFAQYSQQDKAKRMIITGTSRTDRDIHNSRDIIIGGDRRIYNRQGTTYPYTATSNQDLQTKQVKRNYSARDYTYPSNHQLSGAERKRIDHKLNSNQVNGRYNNKHHTKKKSRWNDDNKRYKSNNGNHYGWEKGKGNQRKMNGKWRD